EEMPELTDEDETDESLPAEENADVSDAEESTDETPPDTQTASEPVGPDNFPEDINPLTGLPAVNTAYLGLPPAFVSISNFPASARPQAGLGSSPITYEIAIGEGMTRFLAMFYGQFPENISGQTEGQVVSSQSDDESEGQNGNETAQGDEGGTLDPESGGIGPVRSGRLPYEDIRSAYSGFLVMSSAWEGVASSLSGSSSVYGSDCTDINSAVVDVNKLIELAQSRAESYIGSNFNLEGMRFSETPIEGGLPADKVWIFYSALNQVQWRYEADLGAYVRYDITTDWTDEFIMATDRLTGEPLSKENVIVIFAEHDYQAPTLIDINFKNRPPTKALLFRDGQMYQIFWTTKYGEYEKETGLLRPMRFVDADGNPVALKPGQTWISVVSLVSYFAESAISETPFHPVVRQEGTGLWLVRYKGKY
ncbi:MAG: DUF3048 C-terminal domain-containing protein, partial [Chloroflexota bacterium]|nr:DUF3048 C-terminal domain-containing protein [Chloroflexota bacterium]